MSYDIGRVGKKAATNALTTLATTGSPEAALVSTVPALLSGFETKPKFNPNRHRAAMSRLARGVRNRARRDAQEIASQTGTYLARQGLQSSGLGAGIAAGNQRMAQQRATDYLNQVQGNLEFQIANEQAAIDEENRIAANRDWQNLAAASGEFIGKLATPGEDDTEFMNNLRSRFNLPTYEELPSTKRQRQHEAEMKRIRNHIYGLPDTPASTDGPTSVDAAEAIVEGIDESSEDVVGGRIEPEVNKGIGEIQDGRVQPDSKGFTAETNKISRRLLNGDKVRNVNGEFRIQPRGTNIEFSVNSNLGKFYIENPNWMQDFATFGLAGGWERLADLLDTPYIDLNRIGN